MKKSILIKILLILLFIVIVSTGNVKAMYQSTPYTHENPSTNTWDTWLTSIRQMETDNQVMGLTETLNGTGATSDSNNIDVHMMKGTEYYAISILSASIYGNPNNTQKPATSNVDSATTNKTGVYYNYNNWEFLATLGEVETNAFSKYYDRYNTLNLKGLSPSGTWHSNQAGNSYSTSGLWNPRSSGGTNCLVISDTPVGYFRTVLTSTKNGIFSYNWESRKTGYRNDAGGYSGDRYRIGTYVTPSSGYSRAAIVNFTGI